MSDFPEVPKNLVRLARWYDIKRDMVWLIDYDNRKVLRGMSTGELRIGDEYKRKLLEELPLVVDITEI